MTAIHEDNLFAAIIKGSIAFLLLFSLIGLIFFSTRTALSVLMGGFIGIANFIWMRNTLRRILGVLPSHPGRTAVFWFVARMSIMAVVLYLLMVSGLFSLIGLVAGLSVVVAAIMFFSFYFALRAKG